MVPLKRSMAFPFPGDKFPADLGAVVQRTVADGEMPALVVVHDDENEWLIGDGVTDASPEACGVFHILHIVNSDPSLKILATLPVGYVAERGSTAEKWAFNRWVYSDE
jgi:hypothetical protein